MKRELQAFFTPDQVAYDLVELADVYGRTVLEPSAGDGALVRESLQAGARDCTVIEINPDHAAVLEQLGCVVVLIADFLEILPESLPKFERVVMNPPFADGQAALHVLHALKFLKPGGILVSVMPGTAGQCDRFLRPLLELLDDMGADYERLDLPERAFRSAGTNVNTHVLKITCPN